MVSRTVSAPLLKYRQALLLDSNSSFAIPDDFEVISAKITKQCLQHEGPLRVSTTLNHTTSSAATDGTQKVQLQETTSSTKKTTMTAPKRRKRRVQSGPAVQDLQRKEDLYTARIPVMIQDERGNMKLRTLREKKLEQTLHEIASKNSTSTQQ
ncbi:expressed unknown protein [Seminavis robusta]|uniref:Uncharacterized protein n=1 Tax=Seminavis robusta TaxID=568900 RepID=A0A9N8DQW9_9STRA|nr:expressed unknown protein [Seminavis robusta]|eukprot:Sro192_g082480.1 n/a (153) ;mRNA; r:40607-41065